jgi:hypothetical protein
MHDERFDLLTRTLGRRGVARLLLGLAGLTPLAVAGDDATAGPQDNFCEIKGKGERCRRGNQCCSGSCKRRKGKKRGKCRCSPLQAPCSGDFDCCPLSPVNQLIPTCGQRDMNVVTTCCLGPGGHCTENADCCGVAACTGGECEA